MLRIVTQTLSLTLLVTVFITAQSTEADSIRSLLIKEQNDSAKVELLLDLAWSYNRTKPSELKTYSQEALSLARQINFDKGIAKAMNLIGISHMHSEEVPDSALYYFENAKKTAETNDYHYLVAEALNNLGIIHFRIGLLDKAFEYYQRAIVIAEEHQMQNSLCRFLNNMGIILKDEEAYDKALKYYNQALTVARELNNQRTISALLSNIGVVYDLQEKYDTALIYYNESLEIKQANDDKIGAVITICNIGSVNASLKNFELALGQSQEGVDLARSVGSASGEITCLHTMSSAHIASKSYEEAIEAAASGLQLARKMKFRAPQAEFHKRLSEAYFHLGDFEKAYSHQDSLITIQDSLDLIEKNKQISELEIQYQLRQKETENQLLKERQIRQSAVIRQRSIISIATLVILALISWLAWTYYRSAREKKRYNSILKNEVRERTSELQHSNQQLKSSNLELERFAYVASHDLKEPLRNMILFNELIQSRLQDQISDEIKEYFSFVSSSGQRMYHLIESTLEFSKINQLQTMNTQFDLNKLIEQVQQALHNQIKERNARIICEDLPVINSKHDQLYLVFKNLVENGIKYNQSETPTIKISYENGTDHQICVADNGIGIKKEYQQQVFEMFKRLHQNDQYPGTGLGLSIVDKILRRMHGSIHLESEEGRGSRFYINLPKD